MSKIIWDKNGERFYEAGVKNAVLFPKSGENGDYATGVAWNGITSVKESPDGGEANDMWADGIKYGSIRGAESFGGTIEAYIYPDEFAVCDGSAEPAPGVIIGQQSRVPFGLSYRTEIGNDTSSEPNVAYKLHVVYGCTANPSERDHQTINDSPEGETLSWDFDTTPVPVKGYKPVSHLTLDSRKIDRTKLTSIEDILYGSEDQEPRLLLPDEIITLVGGSVQN